jgi:polar amino acid transport system substrate-binding protein
MPNLVDLYVGSNSFTGTLPSCLGSLTKLVHFYMGISRMHGTVPSSIGLLTGLESLAGRQIGSVRSYSYSAEIDAWLAANPGQVQAISGSGGARRNLRKLLAGRIDVMLDDAAVAGDTVRRSGQGLPVRVTGRLPGGSLHIALGNRRGNHLAAILDRNIHALRASGRLAAILAEYGLTDWTGR